MRFVVFLSTVFAITGSATAYTILCEWDPTPSSNMPAQLNMPSCTGAGNTSVQWVESPPCVNASCFAQVTVTLPFDTVGGYNCLLTIGNDRDFQGWSWNPLGPTTSTYVATCQHTATCSPTEHVDAALVVWCWDAQGNLAWLNAVWKTWGKCKGCPV